MKTFLIGLDGATFSILDSFMEAGVMPFLKGFMDRGIRAELLSTPNPLTPPAWTSLMTGRSPGNHGVFDFIRPEETEAGVYAKLVDFRDIQCETVWSIASRERRKVISLNYPVMFPPPQVNGYIVPGFVSWRYLKRAVYPSDLYGQLKVLPSFSAKELAWDMYKERMAVQALPQEQYEEWIGFHHRREHQWYEILRFLMERDACDLIAVLFDGVDKVQHLCWHLLDPASYPKSPSTWEQRIRDLCLDYFRQLDGFLANIVRTNGEDVRVFIVSDHGFGPTWDIFYLNVWLHQQGHLQWGPDAATLDDSESFFAARRMKTQLFDWDKTSAYALTPSSNGIYIRVSKGPGQPGIPAESYDSFRRDLIASLLSFTDPRSGESIVKRVMTREEVFSGAQMQQAPDLTLVLRDQGFISILNADSPLKRRRVPKGMHRPEGIFLAAGQGIQRGLALPELSILDVCPALLYSLGLSIPEDQEGRFPAEIFEPALLKAEPARVGPPSWPVAPAFRQKGKGSLPTSEEKLVLSRLRALGYVE